jgi:hypothetical protein
MSAQDSIAKLAEVLRERYGHLRPARHPAWDPYPLRVLDCALAIDLDEDGVSVHRKAYWTDVVPRVEAFRQAHPEVRTLTDLRNVITSYPTPQDFAQQELEPADPRRGEVVLGLVDHLLREKAWYGQGTDEAAQLAEWALCSTGGDSSFSVVGFERFRSAGFQYLRSLFGAPVLVPGGHHWCYATEVLGTWGFHSAEELVGEAAALASLPLAAVDQAIWMDHACGRSWTQGAEGASSAGMPGPADKGAWVDFFEDVIRLLEQYYETNRLEAAEVARLHERTPHRPAGAEHAFRGDYLAAMNALTPREECRCYSYLAFWYLSAFYDVLLRRSFDVEDDLAVAHKQTVLLIRHFRDSGRYVDEDVMRCLRTLAETSGSRILPRDRMAP